MIGFSLLLLGSPSTMKYRFTHMSIFLGFSSQRLQTPLRMSSGERRRSHFTQKTPLTIFLQSQSTSGFLKGPLESAGIAGAGMAGSGFGMAGGGFGGSLGIAGAGLGVSFGMAGAGIAGAGMAGSGFGAAGSALAIGAATGFSGSAGFGASGVFGASAGRLATASDASASAFRSSSRLSGLNDRYL